MNKPPRDDRHIYAVIVGLSALLCFAMVLTGSFGLTLAIMGLGGLHAARYFPQLEAFIAADPLLIWLRRLSPLLILGMFGIVVVAQLMR